MKRSNYREILDFSNVFYSHFSKFFAEILTGLLIYQFKKIFGIDYQKFSRIFSYFIYNFALKPVQQIISLFFRNYNFIDLKSTLKIIKDLIGLGFTVNLISLKIILK